MEQERGYTISALSPDEQDALANLADRSEFFASMHDFYTANGVLPSKQAAKLRERMAEDGYYE